MKAKKTVPVAPFLHTTDRANKRPVKVIPNGFSHGGGMGGGLFGGGGFDGGLGGHHKGGKFGSYDYRTAPPIFAYKHPIPFKFFATQVKRPVHELSIHEP